MTFADEDIPFKSTTEAISSVEDVAGETEVGACSTSAFMAFFGAPKNVKIVFLGGPFPRLAVFFFVPLLPFSSLGVVVIRQDGEYGSTP